VIACMTLLSSGVYYGGLCNEQLRRLSNEFFLRTVNVGFAFMSDGEPVWYYGEIGGGKHACDVCFMGRWRLGTRISIGTCLFCLYRIGSVLCLSGMV
jgi:hypothetical protein